MVGSLFAIGENSTKRKIQNSKISDLGGFQLLETRGKNEIDQIFLFGFESVERRMIKSFVLNILFIARFG